MLLLLILFTGHLFYLELMTQQKKALGRNAFFMASPTSSSMNADCFAHDILLLLQSGADYSPRFVFQSYSAYTPALLKKNAEHFLYENAPDYLFCGNQEIDGRLPSSLDSPSLLQILNNYQVFATGKTLKNTVLKKRKTKPQPPELRELSTVSCAFHSPIPVPASSRLIWMTAEIRQTLPGLLLKYAVRPVAVNVHLTLDNGETLVHRIIPTCSQVPFLISPYLDKWENLSSLFANHSPRVVQISFSPIFRFANFDRENWERKVGKLAYEDKINVHFFESGVPSDHKGD